MFYEQLKPNKVINHCKSVLKYTHQFCQQTLVKSALPDGLVNFCFKHPSCFLQTVSHFLIFLVKQTKIALFKTLRQAEPQFFKGNSGSKLHEQTSKLFLGKSAAALVF